MNNQDITVNLEQLQAVLTSREPLRSSLVAMV